MKSQVKWGIAFIAIGLVILPLGYPYLLMYTILLVIIGMALIIFRNREVIIEKAETKEL
ncbi:MAG: hypothetical protein JW999_10760 [Methanotrichaceae archaeon]|nr:hypothetical protein [Methanotrichaceae archaeon]